MVIKCRTTNCQNDGTVFREIGSEKIPFCEACDKLAMEAVVNETGEEVVVMPPEKPEPEDPLKWVNRLALGEIVHIGGIQTKFHGSADEKKFGVFKFDPTLEVNNRPPVKWFCHKGVEFTVEGYQKLDNGHVVLIYKVTGIRKSNKWR